MPFWFRAVATIGLIIQGGSVGFALIVPRHFTSILALAAIYMTGFCLMNGALTSEFVRKMQLEADQLAAQQIQQTLHVQNPESIPGYELETLYRPYRDVGGDYFDVIPLSKNRVLFALADVSGKGMPAALLAANIQALVRSMAHIDLSLVSLAKQINAHLNRYTPSNRFATAVFVLLNQDSGSVSYVNAGHNSPVLSGSGTTLFLEATGLPLGLMASAEYQEGSALVPTGGSLLLFTDGLTDSIGGSEPEKKLSEILADSQRRTMSELKALLNPKYTEDDVTILLLKRARPEIQ